MNLKVLVWSALACVSVAFASDANLDNPDQMNPFIVAPAKLYKTTPHMKCPRVISNYCCSKPKHISHRSTSKLKCPRTITNYCCETPKYKTSSTHPSSTSSTTHTTSHRPSSTTHTNTPQPTQTTTTGGEHADALVKINNFRATRGLLPLVYRPDGEACAKQAAIYDSTHGFHASFYANMCPISGSQHSQCECSGISQPGLQGSNDCVQLFINEGPCVGGFKEACGHFYLLFQDTSAQSVAINTDENGFWVYNIY